MIIADQARGLPPIYAGRVLTGVGIGIVSTITPIFISEVAVVSVRGRLIGLYELGWQLGKHCVQLLYKTSLWARTRALTKRGNFLKPHEFQTSG